MLTLSDVPGVINDFVQSYCLKGVDRMKNRRFLLAAGLIVMGLLPMACSRDEIAPTEAPAEEPTEAPAEEPIVAPAPETEEEPAAEPEEEVMEFEPLSVAADSCDYGGKIESIEATDERRSAFCRWSSWKRPGVAARS
jgi:hypothetical protein